MISLKSIKNGYCADDEIMQAINSCNLREVIQETRMENVGVSIYTIARIFSEEFSKEEVEVLVEHLTDIMNSVK